MILKKIIIIIFLVFNCLIVFSEAKGFIITRHEKPVHLNAVKNLGEFFIKYEDIKTDDLIINETNNVIFIIRGQRILELSKNNRYSKINFLTRYDNSLLFIDNELYINSKVIADFFEYNLSHRLNNIYFFNEKPRILNISYSIDEIIIELDSFIHNNNISLNIIDNSHIVSIFPLSELRTIPSQINYSYSTDTVHLRFISDFNYNYRIEGRFIYIQIDRDSKTQPEITTRSHLYSSRYFEINNTNVLVHMVKFNLNDFNLLIETNDLGKRRDFKDFLEEKKPVASINSSFFDTNTIEPIGNIIKDYQLIHLSAYSRPAFFIDKNNKPHISYIKIEYQVELNGLLFWVKAINSNWTGDVSLYTSHYKGNISESENDYVFYLIENNRIISKEKINPKQNQKLLLISRNYERHLQNINIGDEVSFRIESNYEFTNDIKFLVEGGPIIKHIDFSDELMIEEQRSYSPGIISGRTSRTFLGIDDNNNIIFFVTEGNNDNNAGVNYFDAQNIVEQLGNIKKAIMFDGGGSSVLYFEGEIMNPDNKNMRNFIPVFLNIYPKDK